MKDIEIVEIDNKKYGIMKEIIYKDTTYLYLSNIDDNQDVMIRKLKDNDTIIPLDNGKEFDIASTLLLKDSII